MALLIVALATGVDARATDACSSTAIVTAADVAVSDGTAFSTRSYFHSSDFDAIRHIDDTDRIVAVEGPFGWAQSGDSFKTGEGFYKRFALGHQYHALLLHFDEIVDSVQPARDINIGGKPRDGKSGPFPYGGVLHLLDGDSNGRPAGLVLEIPDSTPITATFLDWHKVGDIDLPKRVQVDDGQRIFDYSYTEIDVEPRSPTWFFEAVAAPADNAVQILRLHRKLLAAHCLGDADMMAALSAPTIVTASRGEIAEYDNAAMRDRFAKLFERLDYREYHDVKPVVVDVSSAGDVGWIAVATRAVGTERNSGPGAGTGNGFSAEWAWIMGVRKLDGTWRHVANASNAAR